MSGPVDTDVSDDTDLAQPETTAGTATATSMEITAGRETRVGETIVHRALPTRTRRTVGAWCFLDHVPTTGLSRGGMQIGPHPHIGLQTVTWLLAGEVVHRDSLGSEQVIRPGQSNLMTAGRGVVHAEETPATFQGELHAVQLWVAQPERTRHTDPEFEHHADLPEVEMGAAVGTVLVGAFAGVSSPARRDTDHVGVDLVLRPGATAVVPLDRHYEHAIVVLDGIVSVGSRPIGPDELAYVGAGRDELQLVTTTGARALLLGGTPFETRPLMWWNFVARSHTEVEAAYRAWQSGDDRFGPIESDLAPIPAPTPPWMSIGDPFHAR